jgi:hypothetical protein
VVVIGEEAQRPLRRRPAWGGFEIFGPALQEKIGVFHSSSLQMVPKLQTHHRVVDAVDGVKSHRGGGTSQSAIPHH